MLFGPAYKGIPLAAATAVALADATAATCRSRSTARKRRTTAKAARIVGAPLRGRVLIVDDVITAGTAIREAIDIIRQRGAHAGRRGARARSPGTRQGQLSAVQEVEQTLRLPVTSILQLADLIEYLEQSGNADQLAATRAYRAQYGVLHDKYA